MQRYLLCFLAPVAVIVLMAALLAVYFEPISGDLTRIGSYAERDFGWNGPQAPIHINANGSAISRPDVLVLGDSFSESNIWQSLIESRIKTRMLSFTYEQSGCVTNWIEYALTEPSSKTVIVESVERYFVERFADMAHCSASHPVPFERAPAESTAMRTIWPNALHLEYTFKTAFNTLEMDFSHHTLTGNNVVNAPLKRSCAKFSNRRADRLLYYAQDNNKLQWNAQQVNASVTNLRRIQEEFAMHGKKFIFVLIPDKSSAYRDCLSDDPSEELRKQVNPTKALIAAGVNTPDLMREFQEGANRVVDLYLPNDTHLSSAGFSLMAMRLEPFFTY